jgi:hypothetical protein
VNGSTLWSLGVRDVVVWQDHDYKISMGIAANPRHGSSVPLEIGQALKIARVPGLDGPEPERLLWLADSFGIIIGIESVAEAYTFCLAARMFIRAADVNIFHLRRMMIDLLEPPRPPTEGPYR